jgi:AraC-like DNA-binding protein
VLNSFPDVGFCASRFENIRREIDAFSQIQTDQETLKEISSHLHLKSDTGFSDEQKLMAYREYSKLTAVTLDFLVSKYQFKYGPYVGLINQTGQTKILKLLEHNNCPL